MSSSQPLFINIPLILAMCLVGVCTQAASVKVRSRSSVADITAIENDTFSTDAALSFFDTKQTIRCEVTAVRNESTNEPHDEHEVGHNMQICRC